MAIQQAHCLGELVGLVGTLCLVLVRRGQMEGQQVRLQLTALGAAVVVVEGTLLVGTGLRGM